LFYSKSKKGGTPVDFDYFYGRGADQFAFYQMADIQSRYQGKEG
jgi:hypothetical protein